MTLIKSISGIRGTIGGNSGDNLTPYDITRFATAFARWTKEATQNNHPTVVVGSDARISRTMVSQLITGTLLGMGCDVVNIGMATTPTTEMAVTKHHADGGIIITASHNPKQWNALKLLNNKGEFLSAEDGETLLQLSDDISVEFSSVENLGTLTHDDALQYHIDAILELPLVDKKAIGEAHFSIAIDTINSVGAIALPKLLEQLGVKNIKLLNGEPTGDFAHTPEPLPENLTGIFDLMKSGNYDAGFVVDPDVDRLGIIDETGNFYGEEYTLAVIADYVLQAQKGAVVSNLSSSRILTDVANRYAQTHYQSAVGEVNVVATMKETNAVIGGEGNGGIIYPDLHYGRDSLVGIALYLSYLAKQKIKASALRSSFPNYFMAKNKIELTPTTNIADIIEHLKQHFKAEKQNDADGLRVDIGSEWFHIRPSNTEPIIRIYTESSSIENAKALATKIMALIKK